MQAGDGELGDDHHQDDRCHPEKLPQIDANGAAHETDAEEDGEADTESRAERFENAGGVQPERGKE